MKTHFFSQQGYSLIEMMLIMALLAVLTLSGGFVWQHYRQQARLLQAGQQIAAYLSRLQLHTTRGNHYCRISVTTGFDGNLTSDCTSYPGVPLRFASPLPDIRLEIAAPGYIGLRGLHHTATPTHLALSNPAGEIKIIISGHGRMRLCGAKGRWAGISPCS